GGDGEAHRGARRRGALDEGEAGRGSGKRRNGRPAAQQHSNAGGYERREARHQRGAALGRSSARDAVERGAARAPRYRGGTRGSCRLRRWIDRRERRDRRGTAPGPAATRAERGRSPGGAVRSGSRRIPLAGGDQRRTRGWRALRDPARRLLITPGVAYTGRVGSLLLGSIFAASAGVWSPDRGRASLRAAWQQQACKRGGTGRRTRLRICSLTAC